MPFTVRCPDCDQDIPQYRFVEHRENEHPPKPIVLQPAGAESQARMGYTDDSTEA